MPHPSSKVFVLSTIIFTCVTATSVAQSDNSAFEPTPSRITPGVAEGTATLSPNELHPADIGDYTLTFTVGESGIAEGGGVLVDFPKAWFTNPVPRPKEVQTSDPDGPHYVDVSTSRRNVEFDVAIERENLDGKVERFRKIIHVTLTKGRLRLGDTIAVTLRNTTCPYIAGEGAVTVAVDAGAIGEFHLAGDLAPYRVLPGRSQRTRITAPSQAVVNEPVTIQTVCFDVFDNVAIVLGQSGVNVAGEWVPLNYDPEHLGMSSGTWTPKTPGVYVIEVSNVVTGDDNDGQTTEYFGGPIRVYESEPELNVYWGDLHSHSNISKDAIGTGDWAYARDVARLDFFGSSEHDVNDAGKDSITPAEWETIRKNVRDFCEPGKFVTLLGYECSLPNGHHNVFYRGLDGVPWPSHRLGAIEVIWEKLQAGDAITIPHHPGIRWGGFAEAPDGPGLQAINTAPYRPVGGPQVDWSREQNDALRPVVEIYSKHGQSEYYKPDDPLSYEQVRFTPAYSVDRPHYVQDAWAMDIHVGAVAASDNHCSHPGLAHTGLTGVFAPELTRDAIFDALLARRCYATTGERILLEFEIAGAKMGEVIKASGTVQGRVFIAAPTDIGFAEVLLVSSGSKEWRVAKRWDNPESVHRSSLEQLFEVSVPETGATLYLRCELTQKTNGRVARAWSSPIWLEP